MTGQGLPPTGRVVHINNLKVYHERKVYRAVVAVEEEIDQQVLKGKSILTEEPCVGFSQSQLDEVLSEFKDTFSDTPGCCSTNQCHITLNSDTQPVNLPVRRIFFTMRDGVKAALDKMVGDGVIVKVDNTSWCSPIVPVKKPDGTVRVCVDYRALNDRTPLMRHYMPTLDELLDKAGGCGELSTLSI